MTRALLKDANQPKCCWGYAKLYAGVIRNKNLSNGDIVSSPADKWFQTTVPRFPEAHYACVIIWKLVGKKYTDAHKYGDHFGRGVFLGRCPSSTPDTWLIQSFKPQRKLFSRNDLTKRSKSIPFISPHPPNVATTKRPTLPPICHNLSSPPHTPPSIEQVYILPKATLPSTTMVSPSEPPLPLPCPPIDSTTTVPAKSMTSDQPQPSSSSEPQLLSPPTSPIVHDDPTDDYLQLVLPAISHIPPMPSAIPLKRPQPVYVEPRHRLLLTDSSRIHQLEPRNTSLVSERSQLPVPPSSTLLAPTRTPSFIHFEAMLQEPRTFLPPHSTQRRIRPSPPKCIPPAPTAIPLPRRRPLGSLDNET
ncbi:hypothetical protein SARC_09328 [Sphaeroforma arctica JP610]|uniref:Uncharacterized protein n=1 Tax=Sphaeroforma arctica JP610 TaxID=667725 RepID=A0A0L0FND3_9EUKA|nr:hypothetical protein SARC_09328 [Sphaeroforma arctica JP610]KNC78234.1 hypothetical protein SARC_09328 [Sphaeroforma arctica JP610]|eukprot:XP_014152136.1 hypothetical protein SARC_09328 [Sphaeroforma arctica JP610]